MEETKGQGDQASSHQRRALRSEAVAPVKDDVVAFKPVGGWKGTDKTRKEDYFEPEDDGKELVSDAS